jgi:hypothetical protein
MSPLLILPPECLCDITGRLSYPDIFSLWATGNLTLQHKLGYAGGVQQIQVEMNRLRSKAEWPYFAQYLTKLTYFSLKSTIDMEKCLHLRLSTLPPCLQTLKLDLKFFPLSIFDFDLKTLFPRLKILSLQALLISSILSRPWEQFIVSNLPTELEELTFFPIQCADAFPPSIIHKLPKSLKKLHISIDFPRNTLETDLIDVNSVLPLLEHLKFEHGGGSCITWVFAEQPKSSRGPHEASSSDLQPLRGPGLKTLCVAFKSFPVAFPPTLTFLRFALSLEITQEFIMALPRTLESLVLSFPGRFNPSYLIHLPRTITSLSVAIYTYSHSLSEFKRDMKALPPNISRLPPGYHFLHWEDLLPYLPKSLTSYLLRPKATRDTVSRLPTSLRELTISRLHDVSAFRMLAHLHSPQRGMRLTTLIIHGGEHLNLLGKDIGMAAPHLTSLQVGRIASLEGLPKSISKLIINHAASVRHFGRVDSANGITVKEHLARRKRRNPKVSPEPRFAESPIHSPHLPNLTVRRSSVPPSEYIASLPRSLEMLVMQWKVLKRALGSRAEPDWTRRVAKLHPIDPTHIFCYLPPTITGLRMDALGDVEPEMLRLLPKRLETLCLTTESPLTSKRYNTARSLLDLLPSTICAATVSSHDPNGK